MTKKERALQLAQQIQAIRQQKLMICPSNSAMYNADVLFAIKEARKYSSINTKEELEYFVGAIVSAIQWGRIH